jgi:uncharacterized membrane protein
MSSLSRHIREHDAERQARSERLGRALRERLPTLLPEYLNTLVGALIGFWLLAELLSWLAGVDPLYTVGAIGLLYSTQATYYTFRLAADPAFTVPKCACAGRAHDATEVVLRSPASAILRVPNALFGSLWYAGLIVLVATGNTTAALPLALVAVAASAALGVVMVTRVRALCPICINTAAINVLILLYLVL